MRTGFDGAHSALVAGVQNAKLVMATANAMVPREARHADDHDGHLALEAEVMQTVEQRLGAVARPARVHSVGDLPKTRSGKLLRRAIQAVCEQRDPGDLTTMEDPAALKQISDLVTVK